MEAAAEIDRLVLSVSRAVGRNHGDRFLEMARPLGLDDVSLLPYLGDFMVAGNLTREVALARTPYSPPGTALGRLDELEEKGLLVPWGSGLGASPGLRHLLQEMGKALATEAAAAWRGHEDAVDPAARFARIVSTSVSSDHVVAAAHRECLEPDDRYQRLHQRLVTLRYIRQHDHVQAWKGHDLAADEIVVLTHLWHDEEPGDSAAVARMRETGLVDGEPPSLTRLGREVRDAIEDDTNRRARESFSVLDERTSTEFLAALRALPGES